MSTSVTSTELARKLGDYLARVRYRHESFVVERNGVAIARVTPAGEAVPATLAEALAAWTEAGSSDPGFAADLERVGVADALPKDPWAS